MRCERRNSSRVSSGLNTMVADQPMLRANVMAPPAESAIATPQAAASTLGIAYAKSAMTSTMSQSHGARASFVNVARAGRQVCGGFQALLRRTQTPLMSVNGSTQRTSHGFLPPLKASRASWVHRTGAVARVHEFEVSGAHSDSAAQEKTTTQSLCERRGHVGNPDCQPLDAASPSAGTVHNSFGTTRETASPVSGNETHTTEECV